MSVGNDVGARDERSLSLALDRLGPWIERAWSPRATGAEHLDREGAALVVGNHSGGQLAMLEPLVLAQAVRQALPVSRLPHLLLHEAMWRGPLAPRLARLGAVRASPENANALLDRDARVLVYPGGDREAFRGFRARDRVELGPRRGYVKLAITRGVPIVPVVSAGMHSGIVCLHDGHALARRFPLARALRVGVLPVTLSAPFGLTFGVPPPYFPVSGRVRIRVLPALRFARRGAEAAADADYVEACHRTVVFAMQRALDELASERRAERREALHRGVDRVLDLVEEWTLLPRATRAPKEPRGSTVAHIGDVRRRAA